MSTPHIIGWLLIGVVTSFITSKLVNKTGTGLIRDLCLGIASALIIGKIINLLGVGNRAEGLNIISLVSAAIGAALALVIYHATIRHKIETDKNSVEPH